MRPGLGGGSPAALAGMGARRPRVGMRAELVNGLRPGPDKDAPAACRRPGSPGRPRGWTQRAELVNCLAFLAEKCRQGRSPGGEFVGRNSPRKQTGGNQPGPPKDAANTLTRLEPRIL